MIKLNTNYQQLLRQIHHVEEKMLLCQSFEEARYYWDTYDSLITSYQLCTGKSFSSSSIMENMSLFQSESPFFQKYHNNYLENKKFHHNMFSTSFFEMDDILDDYFESSEYLNLSEKEFVPLDSSREEEKSILEAFLKETDMTLFDIYQDMQQKGHIYGLTTSNILGNRPFTIFNSIENGCSIFLPNSCNSISFLEGLVHELGHAKDFLDVSSKVSKKAQYNYFDKSIYPEVLSTKYEQEFLQFLIDNNIHKEEAQYELAAYFNTYLSFLDSALIYTILPDEYHFEAIKKKVSDMEIYSFTNNYLDTASLEGELSPLNDFTESIEYSYGILLANSIMDSKGQEERFLINHHDYFDKNDLLENGLSSEVVAHNITTKVKTYLKH